MFPIGFITLLQAHPPSTCHDVCGGPHRTRCPVSSCTEHPTGRAEPLHTLQARSRARSLCFLSSWRLRGGPCSTVPAQMASAPSLLNEGSVLSCDFRQPPLKGPSAPCQAQGPKQEGRRLPRREVYPCKCGFSKRRHKPNCRLRHFHNAHFRRLTFQFSSLAPLGTEAILTSALVER